jgi:hypothetical protein
LPEVICLQEVDSFHALKAFHDRYLKRIAREEYPHKALIEGNDPRGIDVAVLSLHPIDSMSTPTRRTPRLSTIPRSLRLRRSSGETALKSGF